MKTNIFVILLVVSCSLCMAGWENIPSPVDSHLRSISYLDSDSVYVAGSDGTIIHYDGSHWNIFTPITDKNLNAITMISDESGWAAGTGGTMLRYTEGAWSIFPTEDEQRAYNDIIAFAEDDVYFIGYSLLGGSVLEHWDGTELTEMKTFSDNLVDLEGSGPDNLWVAGGNGYVTHYDGTQWDDSYGSFIEPTKIFDLTLNDDNYPVLAVVEGSGWDRDMVLEYDPVNGWTSHWLGYEKRLMCIDVNEKRGFALGSGGRIVEYSIFGWQELTALGPSQINDIHLADMSQGWAVADTGKIYRYKESTINIVMDDVDLAAGDSFNLSVELLNPGATVNGVMEIVMLEAYGLYYFWPGWTDVFDSKTINMSYGFQELTEVMSFDWPTGAGTGTAAFWGALLDSDSNVLGYDIEPFTWHD